MVEENEIIPGDQEILPEVIQLPRDQYEKMLVILEHAQKWKSENDETKKDINEIAKLVQVIIDKSGIKPGEKPGPAKIFAGAVKVLKMIIFGGKQKVMSEFNIDPQFIPRLLTRYGNLIPDDIQPKMISNEPNTENS